MLLYTIVPRRFATSFMVALLLLLTSISFNWALSILINSCTSETEPAVVTAKSSFIWTLFSVFFSIIILPPNVARLSAARTTPSLQTIPTVVVPVLSILSSIFFHQNQLIVYKTYDIYKAFGVFGVFCKKLSIVNEKNTNQPKQPLLASHHKHQASMAMQQDGNCLALCF